MNVFRGLRKPVVEQQFQFNHAFPNVDAVVYINLDSRADRRVQIESQLRMVFPESKIHRFNAIRETPGWFGCSQSHIEVLRLAETAGWNSVMVVEDDLMWTQHFHAGLAKLGSFQNPDVVLLCGSSPVYDPITFRVTYAGTTTGYIVRREYIPKLRANFEEGLANLRNEPMRTNDFCIDQYWKHLMQRDTWYIIVPGMATQRPGFSDLGGGFVDHRRTIP